MRIARTSGDVLFGSRETVVDALGEEWRRTRDARQRAPDTTSSF